MRPIRLAVVIVALSLVAPGGALRDGSDAVAHGGGIHVGDYYFCDPSYLYHICDTSAKVGEEVFWEVVEGGHTITECDDAFSACPPPGGFDTSVVFVGDVRSHTFTSPGVYEYRCNFHPAQMKGRITVTAADTPTPTPTPSATLTSTTGPNQTATPGVAPLSSPVKVPVTGDAPEGGLATLGYAVLVLIVTTAVAGSAVALRRASKR